MSNVIIPSSDEDKKRIKGCIEEISNSMTRMDAERDFIKEAIASCAEDVEIDKKHLRKMAKIYHKQNLAEVVGEIEDVESLYEGVMV
jgi:archaellum component FlaC|tara:strand:- start:539 stop:799 length:261 start_codon:yes stop_codon:yes gene_type:complete